MGREKKNVTLPIYNEKIFNTLAEIAWKNEENKKNKSKEEFIHKTSQELGKDAFLHSFTPSGEIGSGETKRNPYKSASEFFFDELSDLFGENGKITQLVSQNTNSDKLIKNRLDRIKSSIIQLIDVYVESHQIEGELNEIDRENINLIIATIFFYQVCDNILINYDEILEIFKDLRDVKNKKSLIKNIKWGIDKW
jgi:hypothetical protein